MAIEFAGWGGGDEGGVPIVPGDGSAPRMIPIHQAHGHDYSPANPYELRVPAYPNQIACGVWEVHSPHYWDWQSHEVKYCLGQGTLESINEH